MKKLYILILLCFLAIKGFTQRNNDTLFPTNFPASAGAAAYNPDYIGTDSGWLYGISTYQFKGFAERYDYNGVDSTVKVIGMNACFTGNFNINTNRTVTLNVWTKGNAKKDPVRTHLSYNGFPENVLASLSLPLQRLGINRNQQGTFTDTFFNYFFTTPTQLLSDTFFVGYVINYDWNNLNGDTVGIYTTPFGNRYTPLYTLSGSDTIANVQNAVQYADGSWHETYFETPFNPNLHFLLLPIITSHSGTFINGVKNGNLQVFGHYPNPAKNLINIKFALNSASDATVRITNVQGQVLYSTTQQNLLKGDHTITIPVESLVSGNYIYTIYTKDGSGMSSIFSISN